MSRINILLLLALLGSCLVLVRSAYESRRVFAALDQARLEERQLDAEFKRLSAEVQAQGTHLRVERSARERLRMRTATPAVTTYVTDPAAPAAVAASSQANVALPPHLIPTGDGRLRPALGRSGAGR